MEARDEQARIRPLPPEPSEGAPPDGTEPPPPSRRWRPLAGAAGPAEPVAAATTTTTIPSLGAEAPTTTFTPTTTVPRPLAELLPNTESGLTVAFRDGRFGVVARWEAEDTEPSFVSLTARPDVATFNASGAWLSYLSFFRTDAALHIGLPEISQPAQFVGVTSVEWHPTDIGRLAWVAQPPTSETPALYEGTVDLDTRELVVTRVVAELLPDENLMAWGDWGFLLERRFLDPGFAVTAPVSETDNPNDSRTVTLSMLSVFDPEGDPIAVAPASLRDATGDGTLLVDSTVEAFQMVTERGDDVAAYGFHPDILTVFPPGILLTDPTLTPIEFTTNGPLLPDRSHLLTSDGERVIEIDVDFDTTVTVYSLAGRGTRITNLDQATEVVGLTAAGEFLVLQESVGRRQIFFVDWQSGRIIPIPLAAGVAVAADLR